MMGPLVLFTSRRVRAASTANHPAGTRSWASAPRASCPSQGNRGDQPYVEAGLHQPPGERTVVVAGRLLSVWLDTITVEACWPVVAAFELDQSKAGSTFPMCYGSEFAATAVKSWVSGVGAKAVFIESGSPWESGYVESFNGKLRDERFC
jgi:hypothetical protein